MQVLISPNEFELVKALGEMAFEVDLPYDMQLITNKGIVTIERKTYPDDLIASVRDGRLAKECAAMRKDSDFSILLLEGNPIFTALGSLRAGGRETAWTREGLRTLLRSIRYVEGCDIEYTDNLQGTVEVIREIQAYFDEPFHGSFRTRPKFESSWFTPTYDERFVFWLQGCGPEIGIKRASLIAKKFKSPMEVMQASVGELTEVWGIGEKTAQGIYDFLHKGG